MWTWCRYTRGRIERTHGDVLDAYIPPSLPSPHTTTQHKTAQHRTRHKEAKRREADMKREERRETKCSIFFGVQHASAMDVNAHVHLQSTVILRMASFHQYRIFFEPVQHYHQIPVFLRQSFRTKLLLPITCFISQSANSE